MKKAEKAEILTVSMLAEEWNIAEHYAYALMIQDDFPATLIAPDTYVVKRDLLEKWVEVNARNSFGNELF